MLLVQRPWIIDRGPQSDEHLPRDATALWVNAERNKCDRSSRQRCISGNYFFITFKPHRQVTVIHCCSPFLCFNSHKICFICSVTMSEVHELSKQKEAQHIKLQRCRNEPTPTCSMFFHAGYMFSCYVLFGWFRFFFCPLLLLQ